MKPVGNKMMHLRIIQRLLKKLVQLHQKIDIPQLGTNKPLLFLPYWSKINMTNFRAFVPLVFERLSNSLICDLLQPLRLLKALILVMNCLSYPQVILVVASDKSEVYKKN